MSALRMFIPITKVDAAQRLVYGLATAEKQDRAGEICDYNSTKPQYEKWSNEIARSTRGRSLGVLRAMHKPNAAGKVTAINFNDLDRQIEICVKVVDDSEWEKVVEGVYTGFSQGGAYLKRWTDADGLTRYTAAPTEISLVDVPCLAESSFELIKIDGSREFRQFSDSVRADNPTDAIIQEMESLRDTAKESDDPGREISDVSYKFSDIIDRAISILRTASDERNMKEADGEQSQDSAPSRSSVKFLDKANSIKLRDRSEESDCRRLSCPSQQFASGGLEKSFEVLARTLDDVLQRVMRIEAQPVPLPVGGNNRAISKAEDASGGLRSSDVVDQLLSDPDGLSLLAIKLAHRSGGRTSR
ncbi:hypothetical protein [Methylocapsa acidiphila]|uniref:hypothetical protein n=1 Tax=Methylocapsa acidiphila TaxID=133552 RepID=UPI00041C7207|nr:hypothetical protein [Methylocapsa acidiphila]